MLILKKSLKKIIYMKINQVQEVKSLAEFLFGGSQRIGKLRFFIVLKEMGVNLYISSKGIDPNLFKRIYAFNLDYNRSEGRSPWPSEPDDKCFVHEADKLTTMVLEIKPSLKPILVLTLV